MVRRVTDGVRQLGPNVHGFLDEQMAISRRRLLFTAAGAVIVGGALFAGADLRGYAEGQRMGLSDEQRWSALPRDEQLKILDNGVAKIAQAIGAALISHGATEYPLPPAEPGLTHDFISKIPAAVIGPQGLRGEYTIAAIKDARTGEYQSASAEAGVIYPPDGKNPNGYGMVAAGISVSRSDIHGGWEVFITPFAYRQHDMLLGRLPLDYDTHDPASAFDYRTLAIVGRMATSLPNAAFQNPPAVIGTGDLYPPDNLS